MTRRQTAIAVATGLLVAVVLARLFLSSDGEEAGAPASGGPGEIETVTGEDVTLRLFFPGENGALEVEERVVAGGSAVDLLRAATVEVLAGPSLEQLFAPFPEDTEAGGVFISAGGIAYVDLVSTRPDPPSSGSRDEMLSVYSLVNTLHATVPELVGVVLLWNGQQRASFAGHLDTGRPLTANDSLLLESG